MTKFKLWFLSAAVLAFAGAGVVGCGEEGGGPLMRPGEACGSCHRAGGEAAEHAFSAAGTIFQDAAGTQGAEGVTVEITDAASQVVTLATNSAGNFFTDAALTPPLTVSITAGGTTLTMPLDASANCNSCHSAGGSAGVLVAP